MDATEQGLLRAIYENPADDTPRLVYADWLDENGQPDRAEFIRVQIELAKIPDPPVDTTAGLRAAARKQRLAALRAWKSEWRGRYYDLRTRQQQLLADPHNFVNWTPSVMHTGSLAGIRYETGGTVGLFGNGFESATFTRGFVSEVRAPLSVLMAHLTAIVRAHPVTRVEVTDRVPDWDDGLFQWVGARAGTDGWRFDIHVECLPWSVFERLDGWVRERIESSSFTAGRYYRTEAEARAALSAAAIMWARAA